MTGCLKNEHQKREQLQKVGPVGEGCLPLDIKGFYLHCSGAF